MSKSFISYYGGKAKLSKWLLQFVPEHKCYVEVFGGGAALLLNKPLAVSNVYNDIDKRLFDLFSVLGDTEKFEEFKRKCEATPHSRDFFEQAKVELKESDSQVDRAVAAFVLFRQSFSGKTRYWRYTLQISFKSHWWDKVESLDVFHNIFRRVQIENLDWRQIFKRYDSSDTFFYLDPPYTHDQRVSIGDYQNDFSDEQHVELIDSIQGLKGKVMISGYNNPIYDSLIGWEIYQKDVKVDAFVGRGQDRSKRTECIWLNYNGMMERELKFD